MDESFPCPKCSRSLRPNGSVAIGSRTFLSYQCDECLVNVEMFGDRVEIALTFCVDESGRAFDPAAPDGSLAI